MELVDPVAGVRDEELAHRRGIRAIEIDRVAPLVLVPVAEIRGREQPHVVAARPEVVVDDVEDDADAERVGAIDEPLQIVGPAVQARGRKQIDAVIAPPEAALELRDRHQLDDRDSRMRELGQLGFGRRKRALARERADMQLVDHLAFERHAAPRIVGPFECPRIDDLRCAVRAVGLEARRRIRVPARIVSEDIPVASARACGGNAAEIAAGLGGQVGRVAAFDRDRHTGRRGRPDAKVRAAVGRRLGTDWQSPRGALRRGARGCGRNR